MLRKLQKIYQNVKQDKCYHKTSFACIFKQYLGTGHLVEVLKTLRKIMRKCQIMPNYLGQLI